MTRGCSRSPLLRPDLLQMRLHDPGLRVGRGFKLRFLAWIRSPALGQPGTVWGETPQPRASGVERERTPRGSWNATRIRLRDGMEWEGCDRARRHRGREAALTPPRPQGVHAPREHAACPCGRAPKRLNRARRREVRGPILRACASDPRRPGSRSHDPRGAQDEAAVVFAPFRSGFGGCYAGGPTSSRATPGSVSRVRAGTFPTRPDRSRRPCRETPCRACGCCRAHSKGRSLPRAACAGRGGGSGLRARHRRGGRRGAQREPRVSPRTSGHAPAPAPGGRRAATARPGARAASRGTAYAGTGRCGDGAAREAAARAFAPLRPAQRCEACAPCARARQERAAATWPRARNADRRLSCRHAQAPSGRARDRA